jgi:hypothetical protein
MATAVASEVEQFVALARVRLALQGWTSAQWVEAGLREALLKDGRRLLEGLLSDPSLPVVGDASRVGEKCTAAVTREVASIFGPLTVRRNYYYAAGSGGGRYPLDQALGLVEGCTPMLAQLMTRAGAQSGFAAAAADLKVYGGIRVEGRQIHRMLQITGPQLLSAWEGLPTLPAASPLPVLYVSVDGTGAPMVPEALEGRRGKQPDGSAKTREIKLGCVFTQHTTDPQGHALRDPVSTTYLCGLERSEDFGGRLRQEALRRGMGQSHRTVFLGDGAAWIWEISRVNFRHAVEILDYYHAREHLSSLVEALLGADSPQHARRLDRWESWLWAGQVQRVVRAARRQLQAQPVADADEARGQVAYFERNQSRMRYGQFRQQGLFIGSGVVEAGCKTVIGQRAKQSGMRWSEVGLLNVLHPRCALLGGQFDQCWERRPHPAGTGCALAA